MTRVAILSPSVTSADAVSNDVFGMLNTLTSRGYDARVFAESPEADDSHLLPPEKIKVFLKDPSDLLVYHFSAGWDPGIKLLSEVNCRTAVKYHNVTPPEFFDRYSPDYARLCRDGRNQLPAMAEADCDIYLSDSQYNAEELILAGVPRNRSVVIPPFHNIDRLHFIEPDWEILDRYQDNHTNLLMVGRIVPNKCHAALIHAFAAYHHDYNRKSRLIIVGKEESRLRVYNYLLRELAHTLRVGESVIFTGEVSDSELKAYYLSADAFVITSEHEGFCVPLVEAMAFKVPIVSYDSSAIPATVGDAGLVWTERNPYLLAESVNRIVQDETTGFALRLMGWQRYEQLFSNETITETFWQTLSRFL